jgi:lysine/ornithine N-monooxygenase
VRYAMDKIVIRRSEPSEFLQWLGNPLSAVEYEWKVDNTERNWSLLEKK